MLFKNIKKVKRKARKRINQMLVKGRTKYFCVGRNKTGTTSLKKAFEDLGYIVGDQREAEILYDESFEKDNILKVIDYCRSAEVFQDVPFSYSKVIAALDKAYPNSKFILTIRDDADQWYKSITEFHAKKFGENGRVPTVEDLEKSNFIRKGYMLNTIKAHGTPLNDPYNKEIMCTHYEKHNSYVLEYFEKRPGDLLVINLSDESAYERFSKFLGVDSPYDAFPWENRT